MKKMMVLVLCLSILSSFAYSESVISFNGPGYDALGYACTLADGRMIFTGYRGKEGNYQESRARLLCLNQDKTVSWEYWDPAEGQCGYGCYLFQQSISEVNGAQDQVFHNGRRTAGENGGHFL